MGIFGPKKSKLSVLTENWYTWYIGSADSEFRLRFVKFRPQISSLGKFRSKNQSYPFFLKIGTHGILKMLILIPTLVFWISDPQSIFGQIWAKKSKLSSLAKIGKQNDSKMLILIPTLFFPVSNPKSFFGHIWADNSKLFILTETWHSWYIEDADSDSNNNFLNCQP